MRTTTHPPAPPQGVASALPAFNQYRSDRLLRVARADHLGRPPLAEPFLAGEWLAERARRLNVERTSPRRLVRGRDLLALGLEEGPGLGALLDRCFEAQLDGRFADRAGGLAFARAMLQGPDRDGDAKALSRLGAGRRSPA